MWPAGSKFKLKKSDCYGSVHIIKKDTSATCLLSSLFHLCLHGKREVSNSCFLVSLQLEAKWLATESNAVLAQTKNTVVWVICCHAKILNRLTDWKKSPLRDTQRPIFLLLLLLCRLYSICVTLGDWHKDASCLNMAREQIFLLWPRLIPQ